MTKTRIEWATDTWNPVTGCSHVGTPGCDHCYAERMAKRLAGRFGYPEDDPFRVTLHVDRLDEPLSWRKPRKVFVCSMGDLFHKDVPFSFIASVWDRIFDAPQHTYMILTKRPERMVKFALLMENMMRQVDYPNVWLGVTAEDQETADQRIPILLQTPAAKRFVSCEPMLSEVRFNHHWLGACDSENHEDHGILDWVICGAETGPGKRLIEPDWARQLRDQCQEAEVPFFFKRGSDGSRLLDGREWNEYPG